jgi:hypothetical protein
MNVLNIPKQNNTPLIYTFHAMDRAMEKNVPVPKYLPMNSKCFRVDNSNESERYRVLYVYNGIEYCLVVSESFKVITVYPIHKKDAGLRENQRKSNRQEIKELFQKIDKLVVRDDYICLESEVDSIENYA